MDGEVSGKEVGYGGRKNSCRVGSRVGVRDGLVGDDVDFPGTAEVRRSKRGIFQGKRVCLV